MRKLAFLFGTCDAGREADTKTAGGYMIEYELPKGTLTGPKVQPMPSSMKTLPVPQWYRL